MTNRNILLLVAAVVLSVFFLGLSFIRAALEFGAIIEGVLR